MAPFPFAAGVSGWVGASCSLANDGMSALLSCRNAWVALASRSTPAPPAAPLSAPPLRTNMPSSSLGSESMRSMADSWSNESLRCITTSWKSALESTRFMKPGWAPRNVHAGRANSPLVSPGAHTHACGSLLRPSHPQGRPRAHLATAPPLHTTLPRRSGAPPAQSPAPSRGPPPSCHTSGMCRRGFVTAPSGPTPTRSCWCEIMIIPACRGAMAADWIYYNRS